MFFYIAKVLWFLLQPSTLIALLIGYGSILIWTGWARWGRRFVTFGAILLLVAGLSPLGNALILPLEDRFPRADLDRPLPPAGFIVLGGAEDRLVGAARNAPALNESAERVVEAAMLANRFLDAKIAFSGGEAGVLYTAGSEAEGAAALFISLGIARDRLILESAARDTYENAVLLKKELAHRGDLGAGKRLAADHLGLPHAARHGRLPPGWLRRGGLARGLPDPRARRPHPALRQGLRGLAPGGCGRARMGGTSRLLADGKDRYAVPGTVLEQCRLRPCRPYDRRA